jgi:hypothetical protein
MTWQKGRAEEIKRKALCHLLCANHGNAYDAYAHGRTYCCVACPHEMRDIKKEMWIQIIAEAR